MATKTKFGMLPGDVPKRIKIRMMERNEDYVSPMGHLETAKAIKTWRRVVRKKGKTKLKRRAERELNAELNDLK